MSLAGLSWITLIDELVYECIYIDELLYECICWLNDVTWCCS